MATATKESHCDVQPENQETDELNYSTEVRYPAKYYNYFKFKQCVIV